MLTIVSFTFINSLVAIKKCPYCKAMIEEGAEYCSNCGTKLIFPEDEFIEEEIPGDRVREDDMAEDENGEDSLKEEEFASEEVEEEEASLELDESEVSADWEEVEEEIETPSESQAEETLASAKPKKGKRSPLGEDRFGPIPPSSKSWEDVEDGAVDTEVEPVENGEEADEPADQYEEVEELEEIDEVESVADEEDLELFPEEPSISPDPTTGEISDSQQMAPMDQEEMTEAEDKDFHTEDLENMVDPAEKEKEEIERFLDSLKKERQMRREASEEITEDLPPWAENIKSASSEEEGEIELDESELESMKEEETKIELPAEEEEPAEVEYFEVETEEQPVLDDTPSDIAIEEEKLEQPSLFKKDEGRILFEGFSEKSKRGYRIKPKLVSRLFDVLLISFLWVVSIWGVSYILKMPIFEIVNRSIIPLLGFLGILLLIYFFLFYYFLGETLGDYIFSRGK
ncbi:MAG: zinc ribbon domain-containing protein [Candidatus Aminicenantes bacterium]|nr:zinc ribbon domain-containing protein [Candidatus Aminicenantes bacterium]